jgi:hypothetical protein
MIPMIGGWPQAPDLIEPIIGYRMWPYEMSEREVHLGSSLVDPDDPDRSIGGWEGSWRGWVSSSCAFPGWFDHLAPDEGCSCGFYATKSRDDSPSLEWVVTAQAENSLSRASEGTSGVVFGRVDLAGKVIEHDLGYRAERARIMELIPTTTDGGITELLAARLDLPVGSAIDTTALFQCVRQEIESQMVLPPAPRALTPIERWRLKTHRRRFRLVSGERDG